MSEPAILARGVSKYFGDFPALRKVDLQVAPGCVLALLGRNGAGKTTFLRMLAGLTSPTDGELSLPSVGADFASIRKHIGVVGHGQWVYDDLSAQDNLRFFGSLYEVRDIERKISEWLEKVGLAQFRRSRVSDFSRGMRQRLAVARAFIHEPAILLLDEPWTALDDRAMRLLSSLVVEAREAGRTVVICSHQLREALEVSDEIALLDRGKIVFRGPNDDGLRNDPESLYERIA